MPILEDLKEYTERATGLKRPGKQEASDLARVRKPHAVRFEHRPRPQPQQMISWPSRMIGMIVVARVGERFAHQNWS